VTFCHCVGWQGVFFKYGPAGGICLSWVSATGLLRCNAHTCINGKRWAESAIGPKYSKFKIRCGGKGAFTPYEGTCNKTPCSDKKYCPDGTYCDKINPQVCMKQLVLHVEEMSRSAGVFVVKRSSCIKGKCSVFKVHPLHCTLWTCVVFGC